MKNIVLFLCIILSSIGFGQTEMKIYKKNNQLESIPVTQVDSVKYSSSLPTLMYVYKNNNTPILSIPIADIDSIKYLTNTIKEGTITSLNCSTTTNNGTLVMNTLVSGASSEISYTVGNGGTYDSQTIASTGVLGLTASLLAGTFANGNGKLLYTISGTPTTSGTASFAIKIGGKTCELLREVIVPEGKIESLACNSVINNGVLTYKATASFQIESPSSLKGTYKFGFGDSTLNFGWGNGILANKSVRGELKLVNSKDSLAIAELSEDFTGKIALIYRGGVSYAIKALNAQKAGAIAVIFLNHGIQQDGSVNDTVLMNMTGILTGETATTATGLQVKIPIILISKQDRDKILSEIKKGTIIKASLGRNIAIDASSNVAYSGGNGGFYKGESIPSKGVLGLIATSQSSSLVVGNGSVTYQISGVPTSAGTASFEITLAGKTCVFSVPVEGIGLTSGYGPNVSDINGNVYKTIYIGNQQWMAENLKTTKFNDGTPLSSITDPVEWYQTSNPGWCYYNNDTTYNVKYGKLYNWYVVNSSYNGYKNVCPTGWHVPSNFEWSTLRDYLGGTSVASGKLKESGYTSWTAPNVDATNSSLFTALPGGARAIVNNAYFAYLGGNGYFWSSTESNNGSGIEAYSFYLSAYSGDTALKYWKMTSGFSVRCLKD